MSEQSIELLKLLDLEPIEVNLFRGISPQTKWPRVYGGQVIGQGRNSPIEPWFATQVNRGIAPRSSGWSQQLGQCFDVRVVA